MKRLEGKIAIVTGGAGGMGRGYALHLARLGADVAVLDIDLDVAAKYGEILAAHSVAEEIEALGVRAIAVQVDLSQRAAATRAIDEVAAAFGGLDILVNNAGGAITPIDRSRASVTPDEDIDRLFDVNFRTMAHGCQAAVPHMRTSGGSIINVATIGVYGNDIGGRLAMYAAAKAAILRFSQSLAVELGPDNIRVNVIAPGLILTARVAAQAAARNLATGDQARMIPLRRLGQPQDVLGPLEFLASDMSAYVTGECIRVCGGQILVTP